MQAMNGAMEYGTSRSGGTDLKDHTSQDALFRKSSVVFAINSGVKGGSLTFATNIRLKVGYNRIILAS